MNLARPIWPAYALGLCLIAALCFGNLHTHLLDTHDADSFSDHLQIQQDGTFFFSPDKAQASGRPVAEAVKYLVFLICGNDLMAAADVDNRADLVDNFRQQISDAIATSLYALRLRPDADLFYQLGRAYQQQERHAEALEAYRQGLAQNPADHRAHLRIAEILGMRGNQ